MFYHVHGTKAWRQWFADWHIIKKYIKTTTEILELQSTITEMNNSLEEFNSKFELSKYGISESELKSIETIHSKTERKTMIKN